MWVVEQNSLAKRQLMGTLYRIIWVQWVLSREQDSNEAYALYESYYNTEKTLKHGFVFQSYQICSLTDFKRVIIGF